MAADASQGAEAVHGESIVAVLRGVVAVAAVAAVVGHQQRLRRRRLQLRVAVVENGGAGAVHVAVVAQLRGGRLLLLSRDLLLLQRLPEPDEDGAAGVEVALQASGLAARGSL